MTSSTLSASDLIASAIQAALVDGPRASPKLSLLVSDTHSRPLIVGICGSQGSGKSTVCSTLTTRFRQSGLNVANLSLDDLYLPLAERIKLSEQVHPLLRTRGVPGTHDIKLGVETLDALGRAGQVRVPRFDKAVDDRRPVEDWEVIEGPAQLVLFEGWCVGAQPQTIETLAQPVNALEANEDVDGRWRRYVNDALGAEYQTLFAKIDVLVLLAAPSFDVVLNWRTQQEHDLRAQAKGDSSGVMSDAAVARFIQHYERLTKHVLMEMPGRADLVVRLREDRSVLS